MRIAVVAPSPVPFIFGGAERFWLDLVRALNRLTPHEVELLKIPGQEIDFWTLLESYERFFRLDLSHYDTVISSKYPAWMVQHDHHILYLQHKLRGLYDTYPTDLPTRWPADPELAPLGRLVAEPRPQPHHADELFTTFKSLRQRPEARDWLSFPGPATRAVIHFLDRMAMRPGAIYRYGAISRTVADRRDYFPDGVEVGIRHHPSGLAVTPSPLPEDQQAILFTASRLAESKRLSTIIRAFSRLPGHPRLEIAGSGPDEQRLRELAAGDQRIHFLGRLSDKQLASAYARSRAVVFIPQQEDLGLITLEAMATGRAVITFSDSGGSTELIEHGKTGLITDPEENALTEAMRTLVDDPKLAARLGRAGRKTAARVNWDSVIDLLDLNKEQLPARPHRKTLTEKKPVLVLAPFPLRPPRAGGANRIFHLYRALSHHHPVHIITLGPQNGGGNWHFPPNLRVQEIPATNEFRKHADEWSRRLCLSADDIAMLDGMHLLPGYRSAVAAAVTNAAAVVVSHPYSIPALNEQMETPLIYDAHNVEQDLKVMMWRSSKAPAEHLAAASALLRKAEAEAVLRAAAVLAVSNEEQQRLQQLYGEPGTWIQAPNGVALDQRPFIPSEKRRQLRTRLGLAADAPLALFVGSLHQPNIEALPILLETARRLPEVGLLMVGSICEHPQLASPPPNVGNMGKLTDGALALLLGTVDLGLNPVTIGAGTNLKVLDYAAAGAVIVSTPFGARGLPLRHHEQAWLAESGEFTSAIASLTMDDALRSELAHAARRIAEQFSWEQIAEDVYQGLRELIHAPK